MMLLSGLSVRAQMKDRLNLVNDTTVYEYNADKVIARYNGGTNAFLKFVKKNLKWPRSGIDASGRVLMSFIVEKDGTLTNFKVERGIEPSFDAEALNVLKRSPKWIPAKINGKKVRSRYIVPISFDIAE
jgi:TonB family protein